MGISLPFARKNNFILLLMSYTFLFFLVAKAVLSFVGTSTEGTLVLPNSLSEKKEGFDMAIPFTYDNKTISFRAVVNGRHEGEFIFDSGLTTYYNLFSDTFCREELALPVTSSKHKMFGIGVDHQVNVSKAKVSIKVGGYAAEGYYGMLKFSSADRARYDGLFNVHIFKDSIVEFNFDKKQIIFHHEFSGSGYQKIRIIQRGFVRMIAVKASLDNGFEVSGNFLLDTGYWGLIALYCNNRTIDSLRKVYRVNKILGVSNFGKEIDFYRMECNQASIGGAKLLNPTMVVSNTSLPQEAKGIVQGLVGVEFFKMFSPVVDFKNNIMYLKIQPVVTQRNMHEMGVHLFVAKKGIVVKHVIENSEAYNRGLRPNDRVISVNGISVDNLSEQSLISMMDRLYKTRGPVELIYLRGNKRMKSVLICH